MKQTQKVGIDLVFWFGLYACLSNITYIQSCSKLIVQLLVNVTGN